MDPEELFTVSTVSRKDVAEALELEPDDSRLTSEFCQRYANDLHEVECLFDAADESVEELNESYREDLG